MRNFARWRMLLLALLVLGVRAALAQPLPEGSVRILVNRDDVNIRVAPAIGAELLGFVDAGWQTTANARSPDSQWLRIRFNGGEAWVGLAVVTVLEGDVAALLVVDPRSIPYGGFESPRAGSTDATSPIRGRLPQSGVRLRAGPSTAYPILANPLRYSEFWITGRTADNAWLQVNFEGTLGWVTAGWVEIQGNFSVLDIPIDGIVAGAPPLSGDALETYLGQLRFMLDRLNLAQPSLDSIRATWTTVSLNQRAACQNFPARPTDINIPQPLLAAFYPTLEPLRVDFNSAMTNIRLAIDLWLEACRSAPSSGPFGQAVASGALNAIQGADGLVASLRQRINALLPSAELAVDECLFVFQEQFDILKIINPGMFKRDTLTPRKTVTGYCLDVLAPGRSIRLEFLQIAGNINALISLSPFDNPTNFLAVGRGVADQEYVSVGPITLTDAGRYLIVVADDEQGRQDVLTSDFVLLATDVTGLSAPTPSLGRDPVTGAVVINPPTSSLTPFNPIVPTPGTTGGTGTGGTVVCPSVAFTCEQLTTCAEALACLNAGNFTLDPDTDGIPCEQNLCR